MGLDLNPQCKRYMAINPFLDIDKRQIMSPTHHIKYRKIKGKKEKKKKRNYTLPERSLGV